MARTRSIKPGFFDNELLGCLSPLTRLLFIGLWCHADREGRLEDRPRRLKKSILGYDDVNAEDVNSMLNDLESNGFIIRYQVEEMRYIQIITFTKHQNPHMKEKPSEIPPPPGFKPCTRPNGRRRASSENKDSAVSISDFEQSPQDNEKSSAAEESEDGETPQAPASSGGVPPKQSVLEQRFDLFWKAYPKKRAKKAAWAAFKKAKPDEELFDRIMKAIARAKTSKEWMKDDGQYIPNPATWLNGGCWDDVFKEESYGNNIQRHGGGYEPGPAEPPSGAGAIDGFESADPG